MDIVLFPCIYEWEQPNKKSEDNYEDRGFWYANYLNFPEQKTALAYSLTFENFHELRHQNCQI